MPFTLGGTAVAGIDYTDVTAGPLNFQLPRAWEVDIEGKLIDHGVHEAP